MKQGATDPRPLEPGVWAVLATPFRGEELEVDLASLERLARAYSGAGVTGLVALGVLGEAARLSVEEKRLVLETVVEAAGDLPVVCGLSASATSPAVEEACAAARAGARAVMVLVNSADAATLARHLQSIHTACGLGIVVQDHPASTGIAISSRALIECVHAVEAVVAVKSEAPPTAPTIAAIARAEHIPVFGGLGGVGLLDELLAGSAGAMTGFAVPEALVATVRAWKDGGYAVAREAFIPWMPLVLFEAQDKVSLALRKEILRRRGFIDEAGVRPPGAPMPESLYGSLDAHLSAVAPHLAALRHGRPDGGGSRCGVSRERTVG